VGVMGLRRMQLISVHLVIEYSLNRCIKTLLGALVVIAW
jgi:hypothetical protein